MASHHPPNYLRAHRKRLTLSQKEIACLLGATSESKVSNYECFKAIPNLKSAMAYEVIFQTSIRELFAAAYREVEREVTRRARRLVRKAVKSNPGKQTTRKCHTLAALASPSQTKKP